MDTYRVKTTVSKNRTLTIKDLPFQEGETVEVFVNRRNQKTQYQERYPLRGKPYRYSEPFNSVAEDDWEILK
jgi:hypothetical protein